MRSKRRRKNQKREYPVLDGLLRFLLRNYDRVMLMAVVLFFGWITYLFLFEDTRDYQRQSNAIRETVFESTIYDPPPDDFFPTSESMRLQSYMTPSPQKLERDEKMLAELRQLNPFRFVKTTKGKQHHE